MASNYTDNNTMQRVSGLRLSAKHISEHFGEESIRLQVEIEQTTCYNLVTTKTIETKNSSRKQIFLSNLVLIKGHLYGSLALITK